MPFRPSPNDTITITGTTYTFTEHPAAPGMAYGQAGRRGTVYQLADEQGDLWALKVFLRQYREPRLAGQAERVRCYAGLQGLSAVERMVMTGSRQLELIREYPDLAYAVLMPWVSGRTWMEIILEGMPIAADEALQLATDLTVVLVGLEERSLAHCDLSGPNVILKPDGGVELVDLEELYGPELLKPEQLPGGSPGYAHKTAPEGLWNPRADRFSGAVLLGEILGLSEDQVVAAKWGEGYFDPVEMQTNCERYHLLRAAIKRGFGERLLGTLDAAWHSERLEMCPTFTEWLAVLPVEPLKPEAGGQGSVQKAGIKESGFASVTPDLEDHVLPEWDENRFLEESEQAGAVLKTPVQWELDGALEADRKQQKRSPEYAEKSSKDTWLCPVCGQRVEAAEAVCTYCEKGERPVRVSAGYVVAKVSDAVSDHRKELGKRKKWVLPVVIGVVVVMAAAGGLLWERDKRKAQEASAAALQQRADNAAAVEALESQLPAVTAVNPTPYPVITAVSEIDGMEMVYIPAGDFLMGTDEELAISQLRDDQFPQHEVYLDTFWIDRTEVTNARYRDCVALGACTEPDTGDEAELFPMDMYWENEQYLQFPVMNVTWEQAQEYCSWAGRRLPTEAEWEKAARGNNGSLYPWGNAEPDEALANFGNLLSDPVPVGSLPMGASIFGAMDMAGNVWEWVADYYSEEYYSLSPVNNPAGPGVGTQRVIRGGGWLDEYFEIQTTFRRPVDPSRTGIKELNELQEIAPNPVSGIGFRCATSGIERFPGSGEEQVLINIETTGMESGDVHVAETDGMRMVYIPAGSFVMGSPDGVGVENEHPQHEVILPEYFMDETEVTNAVYTAFLNAQENISIDGDTRLYSPDSPIQNTEGVWFVDFSLADFPVTLVTWYGAQAYCEWAGRRLPTEAEWEKAARGTDGSYYPWGEETFSCDLANGGACEDGSKPVGSYPSGASPYGVLDLAGNVREWTADWYDSQLYANSDSTSPTGPSSGDYRAIRGGSWMSDIDTLRSAYRYSDRPNDPGIDRGFRCAYSP